MHVQYSADIEKYQTKPPVKAFDLRTQAQFHGRNQSHITYICCQRFVCPHFGFANFRFFKLFFIWFLVG